MKLNKAKKLAAKLMCEHGLDYCEFEFDRSKNRFGCAYSYGKITLSKYLVELNTEERVRETILHEIAHLLVGVHNHHNYIWKSKMIELGLKPDRCYRLDNTVTPKSKYTLECPNCANQVKVQRKRKYLSACSRCCNEFNSGKYTDKFIMVITQHY